jgi:hypothetical protein
VEKKKTKFGVCIGILLLFDELVVVVVKKKEVSEYEKGNKREFSLK